MAGFTLAQLKTQLNVYQVYCYHCPQHAIGTLMPVTQL